MDRIQFHIDSVQNDLDLYIRELKKARHLANHYEKKVKEAKAKIAELQDTLEA